MEERVFTDILGALGGIILGICTLPQIYTMYKNRSADDVSFLFVLMYSTGVLMSMVLIEAWAGAIPLIIESLFSFVMIGLKVYFDRLKANSTKELDLEQ